MTTSNLSSVVLYKKSSADALLAAFLIKHICDQEINSSDAFIACDESFDFSTICDSNVMLINLNWKPDVVRQIEKQNNCVVLISNHPQLSNWFGHHDCVWVDTLGENKINLVSYLVANVDPCKSVSSIAFKHVADMFDVNRGVDRFKQTRNPTLNYRMKWLIAHIHNHLFAPTDETRLIIELLNYGKVTFAGLDKLIFQISESQLQNRLFVAAGALSARDER